MAPFVIRALYPSTISSPQNTTQTAVFMHLQFPSLCRNYATQRWAMLWLIICNSDSFNIANISPFDHIGYSNVVLGLESQTKDLHTLWRHSVRCAKREDRSSQMKVLEGRYNCNNTFYSHQTTMPIELKQLPQSRQSRSFENRMQLTEYKTFQEVEVDTNKEVIMELCTCSDELLLFYT